MNLKAFALAASALTAAGCMAVSKEVAFDSQAPTGFILLAADGVNESPRGHTFKLQRLDATTLHMVRGGFVDVSFIPWLAIGDGDHFVHPREREIPVRFSGDPAEPGDYALISQTDVGGIGGEVVSCYSLGAPVYRVEPGVITVIPVSIHFLRTDPATTESLLAELLAEYPNMSAPTMFAEPIGSIAFQTERSLMGEVCFSREPVTLTAADSVVGD